MSRISAGTVKSFAVGAAVVALIVAGRIFLPRMLSGSGDQAGAGERAPVTVQLRSAENRRFVKVARSLGNLLARDYADVSSRREGLITAIPVREGDPVKAGETVLFTMEDDTYRQNVEAAERQLEVAQFTLAEKQAGRLKDQADLDREAKDWKRYQELFENHTISESVLDERRAAYKKAEAQIKYADSIVDLAEAQVKVAVANLAVARKDLADAVVRSPLDGFVTVRALEPGQNAKPGDAVVRVENTRRLEAMGYLPGESYPQVEPGKTPAVLAIAGNPPVTLPLTYKAPSVDQALRTYKIKVDVAGDGDRIVPGQLVDIVVELRTATGVGVPKTAVVERDGEKLVFAVKDGKARGIPVKLGIEYENWCEVLGGEVPAGLPLIDGGASLAQVEEGTPVVLPDAVPAAAPGASATPTPAAPAAASAPASAPANPAK